MCLAVPSLATGHALIAGFEMMNALGYDYYLPSIFAFLCPETASQGY